MIGKVVVYGGWPGGGLAIVKFKGKIGKKRTRKIKPSQIPYLGINCCICISPRSCEQRGEM